MNEHLNTMLKSVLPEFALRMLRTARDRASVLGRFASKKFLDAALPRVDRHYLVSALNEYGFNVSSMTDYYSPLPVVSELRKTFQRWYKPSSLTGVAVDVEEMRQLFGRIMSRYQGEYGQLPAYNDNKGKGYGPGFTEVDALTLYCMVRELKPRRYVEIGSGLSTYYCSLAAEKNTAEGNPLAMTCIDPYPREKLFHLPGIEVIAKEVQDVASAWFDRLEEGDVLFIDSTHVVKLDGDVPHLYLEVIPRLKKGVVIHIHDVHLPYNVPYPPQQYVFEWKWWPIFWTEAMLLQAFLAFNNAYRITLSTPLLRYHCEDFLAATITGYRPVVQAETDTHFGSLWMKKVE